MISRLKKFQKSHYFYILLLFIAVFLAYVVALNATFILDDKSGITENPNIGNLGILLQDPKSMFGQLPFHLAYLMGGLNPFIFRLFNLSFHFGSVVCLYFLIGKLFNQRAGFFTGLLFAIHPILIESVTWISALSYTQYSFFLIFTLLAYVKSKDNKKWYYFSFLSAALAIMSSEKTVALVPLIALLEFTFFSFKKNWKKILPYVVITGSYALLYLSSIGRRISNFETDYYIQKQFYNPLEHVPYSITYYLQLIFFPKDLSVYHSELSITIVEFMIRWFVFIALIVSLIILRKKQKGYFFGMLFFFIAVAPTLIPLNIVWVVAERYTYLGTAGVLIFIGVFISSWLEKKKWLSVKAAILMMVFVALFTRTVIRNTDWLTEDSLWISTVKASPSSSNAHNNMGDVYSRRGDYQSASREFQRAIELQPGDADPRHNLGIAYTMMGRYPEAIEAYEGALSIDPRLYKTHQNLGVVHMELKQYPASIFHFEKALEYGPPNGVIQKLLNEVRSLNK